MLACPQKKVGPNITRGFVDRLAPDRFDTFLAMSCHSLLHPAGLLANPWSWFGAVSVLHRLIQKPRLSMCVQGSGRKA